MKGRTLVNLIAWPLLALACCLLAGGEASACSCASNGPPCDAFGEARAVFVGKVVGAKEQREVKEENGAKVVYDVGEIYFKVEEAFEGVEGQTVTIHSGTSGADCGYWFRHGQHYLVYAYGDSTKYLSASICTRTRLLEGANEDLAFLRSLPRKGAGVRIYGSVHVVTGDASSSDKPGREQEPAATPLPGITVKIEGGQKVVDAVTGADGSYEATGLPPGAYKVYAVLPDYYYKDEFSTRKVVVTDRGCAEQNFVALNDGRISGRVLKPDGTGLGRAEVQLIRFESADAPVARAAQNTWADKDGSYELEQLPPGRYLVGVNISETPDKDLPYPKTFYPGVQERGRATVIEIGLGEKLAGIDIQLPQRLPERSLRGFVVWPDGSLAAGVDIYLADLNDPNTCVNGCDTRTDAQGRFVLHGFAGYTYKVFATADRPIAGSKGAQPVYAESVPLNLNADVDGLRLVLSEPGHPWDKEEEKKKQKP